MNKKELFWANDLSGFITEQNFAIIIPTGDMTFAQQLNSVARFALYYSMIMFFMKQDVSALYFFIVVGSFTVLLYYFDSKKDKDKTQVMEALNVEQPKPNHKVCYKPTRDNPFMNVTLTDWHEFPNRPPACDMTKDHVKKRVDTFFDQNLYRDIDDVFHKNASDRQYYTTPNTAIPNDQGGFANWLYKTDKTCKEGNGVRCAQLNTFDYIPYR